jgi:hypothetical protein
VADLHHVGRKGRRQAALGASLAGGGGCLVAAVPWGLLPVVKFPFLQRGEAQALCAAAGKAPWWGLCRLSCANIVFHPRQVRVRARGVSSLHGGGRRGAASCIVVEDPFVALWLWQEMWDAVVCPGVVFVTGGGLGT